MIANAMTKQLKIADNLSLPLDAVTQTFAILAKRGVGKTHTAMVTAEEMLKAGQPIVVYDPTSAWWGLKTSKDGKKPGFPVVIFGGEKADVPLEESAGSTIATVIVEKRIPAILDVGLLRKGARIRFMTDFCETLYHKNREALHFFADEAHSIAPQNLKAMPEAARLLGAMEDIILQGRRRGLGVTVISQRPALVNKNVTTQCEVLIAMQLTSAQDRKSIEEWVDAHGDDESKAKEMLKSLSSLQRGEAWVWSPGWLRTLVRTKFRDRETFDSSATPEVGGRVITPKIVAAVDLQKLGAEIQATVDKAKADDPKELKRRLGEAETKLAKLETKLAAAETKPAKTETIEVPAISEKDHQRLEKLAAGLQERLDSFATQIQDAIAKVNGSVFIGRVTKVTSDIDALLADVRGRVGKLPAAHNLTRPVQNDPLLKAAKPLRVQKPNVSQEKVKPAATEKGLNKTQQRILDALAWYESIGISAPTCVQVGAIAMIDSSGGHFSNNVGPLSTMGLIQRGNGTMCLSDAGRTHATCPEDLGTLDDYHQMVRRRVRASKSASNRTVEILDVILAAGGRRLTTQEIGEAVGIDPSGGHFSNTIGPLTTLGFITRSGGQVTPTEILFPDAFG